MTGGTAGEPRRGRRRGELTVAAVAQLAGVSTATVSKVLNGQSGVGAQTRHRVEALLLEHGYRRPAVTEPTAAVDVVFYGSYGDLATQVMEGVERVARPRELAVVFTNVFNPVPGARSWTEQVLARRPVGVITVHANAAPAEAAQLAVSGIPSVAVDPLGEPAYDTPSVGATNWNGGVTAARHLLGLGHRRIAIISGPADYLFSRARLEGCRAALETGGVPLAGDDVHDGLLDFDHGLASAEKMLRRANRPSAVICGNDLQALGVYEAARRTGLRIPQDLSVVGFDDIPVASWCAPPLTTVKQPLTEMGEAAAEILLTLAAGKTPHQSRIELGTTLVVRESTAPPAQP